VALLVTDAHASTLHKEDKLSFYTPVFPLAQQIQLTWTQSSNMTLNFPEVPSLRCVSASQLSLKVEVWPCSQVIKWQSTLWSIKRHSGNQTTEAP